MKSDLVNFATKPPITTTFSVYLCGRTSPYKGHREILLHTDRDDGVVHRVSFRYESVAKRMHLSNSVLISPPFKGVSNRWYRAGQGTFRSYKSAAVNYLHATISVCETYVHRRRDGDEETNGR